MNKRNMIVILIYSFFNSFLLYRACDVLYYLSKGISNSEYINYLTIGSLITIIFLVPFGIIKDNFNRKYILIFSNIFLLISTIIYIYSNNAFSMGIGIIVSAVSNLLSQGIVVSMLHSYISDEKDYSKMYYIYSVFFYSGYLISMILGGIVAKYSLVLMYYLSIIPIVINFIVLFLFNDSSEKKKDKSEAKFLIKESCKLLKNNKLLKVTLLTEIIIIPVIDILAESHPEYLSNMGASTVLIGIYTAAMCLFAIVGNKIASMLKNQINSYFIFAILYSICLVLIGTINNYFSIVFILLFQCLFSITSNIYNTTVQNECEDNYRQTILAIYTFIISIFEMIICTVISFVFHKFGLGSSYIIMGVSSMIAISIICFIYYKSKNQKI